MVASSEKLAYKFRVNNENQKMLLQNIWSYKTKIIIFLSVKLAFHDLWIETTLITTFKWHFRTLGNTCCDYSLSSLMRTTKRQWIQKIVIYICVQLFPEHRQERRGRGSIFKDKNVPNSEKKQVFREVRPQFAKQLTFSLVFAAVLTFL